MAVARVVLRACIEQRSNYRGSGPAPRDLRVVGDVHARLPYVMAANGGHPEVASLLHPHIWPMDQLAVLLDTDPDLPRFGVPRLGHLAMEALKAGLSADLAAVAAAREEKEAAAGDGAPAGAGYLPARPGTSDSMVSASGVGISGVGSPKSQMLVSCWLVCQRRDAGWIWHCRRYCHAAIAIT